MFRHHTQTDSPWETPHHDHHDTCFHEPSSQNKAPRLEGRALSDLLRVNDITGSEIIPLSVYSKKLCSYVTCGITLDNLFRTIYNALGRLAQEDRNLHQEIEDASAYMTYTANSVTKIFDTFTDRFEQNELDIEKVTSYSYTSVGELHDRISDLQSDHGESLDDINAAITEMGKEVSYNTHVNAIQSSYINTIYHMNDNDIWDDYGNPDDDNVQYQGE